MVAVMEPQISHDSNGSAVDPELLNTLPDPRTPSPGPRHSTSSEQDLSGEVSLLSTKLINAINHSTGLEDTLQHLRAELDAAKRRVKELESDSTRHSEDIAGGALLKKAEVDSNMQKLRTEMEQAKHERQVADKAKKDMELEVENLSASLFERANEMVADARREKDVVERKNAQLRGQLLDTEFLLTSQQEQLQDLKSVMEKMSSERDETETAPHLSTAPSTPATDANKMSRILDSLPLSPGMPPETVADHPLRFSHLITPIVRTDQQAFGEFAELLKTSRAINSIFHSRSASGNASFSSLTTNPSASTSTPHLPGSFGSPITPSTGSPRDSQTSPLPPLKDAKFYKRALTEDIEPTLRLDLAPGLGWLAGRRNVLTAITTGALVIEPFNTLPKLYAPIYACTLCGEERRQDIYARRHCFRTSEDSTTQRQPLCEYCLTRLRATCDFVAFMRMCRDGTWKTANDEDIKAAWDEAVRLRERMFWARMGGGVIPTALRDLHAQTEANKEKVRESGDSPDEHLPVRPISSREPTRKPAPLNLAHPPNKSLPPTPVEAPTPITKDSQEDDGQRTPVEQTSNGTIEEEHEDKEA